MGVTFPRSSAFAISGVSQKAGQAQFKVYGSMTLWDVREVEPVLLSLDDMYAKMCWATAAERSWMVLGLVLERGGSF